MNNGSVSGCGFNFCLTLSLCSSYALVILGCDLFRPTLLSFLISVSILRNSIAYLADSRPKWLLMRSFTEVSLCDGLPKVVSERSRFRVANLLKDGEGEGDRRMSAWLLRNSLTSLGRMIELRTLITLSLVKSCASSLALDISCAFQAKAPFKARSAGFFS